MDGATTLDGTAVEKQDGKHLVFLLGGASYGIPILTVLDINGLMEITPIP